jgi:hypothetical protein
MELKSNRIFGNELKYLKEILETDFRTSAFGVMANRFEMSFIMKLNHNDSVTDVKNFKNFSARPIFNIYEELLAYKQHPSQNSLGTKPIILLDLENDVLPKRYI